MPKAKGTRAYTKADMKAVSDNPEWTAKEFAKAKPFADVFPDLAKTTAITRPYCIRPARAADAMAISAVIVATLRETNRHDYTPEIIARVEHSFTPDAIATLLDKRNVFVAEDDGRIIGTASLDGSVVRTVFVAPDIQGCGVGRSLMAAVTDEAKRRSTKILTVPSSVTAEAFYQRLGFISVRDAWHGDERTIIMECDLTIKR